MCLFRFADGRMQMHEADRGCHEWHVRVFDRAPVQPIDSDVAPPPSARIVTFDRERYVDGGTDLVIFVERGVNVLGFDDDEQHQIVMFAKMLLAQSEMRCVLERRQQLHEIVQRESSALAVWNGEMSPRRQVEHRRLLAETGLFEEAGG